MRVNLELHRAPHGRRGFGGLIHTTEKGFERKRLRRHVHIDLIHLANRTFRRGELV